MADHKIQYDIREFHPDIRSRVVDELLRLQTETPPFGMCSCEVKVVAEFPEEDGNYTSAFDAGYGMSRHNTVTGKSVIFLNETLFGVSGNLSRLNEIIAVDHKKQFHGDMVDIMFPLAHEYGHCVDHWIELTFMGEGIDEGQRIVNAMIKFSAYGVKESETKGHMFFLRMYFFGLPSSACFPSGYSYQSPGELFAECFAVRHFDAGRVNTKPVQLVQALLDVAYDRVHEMGPSLDTFRPHKIKMKESMLKLRAFISGMLKDASDLKAA